MPDLPPKVLLEEFCRCVDRGDIVGSDSNSQILLGFVRSAFGYGLETGLIDLMEADFTGGKAGNA